MKKQRISLLGLLGLILFVWACEKDTEDPPPAGINYSQGVFIVNEGPFQAGSGTITFMSRDGSGITEKLYQKSNSGIPLGNIVQSMTIANGRGYICVNNANKLVVVNIKTFNSMKAIEGISTPRYTLEGLNGKLYVSCWDNTVKVVDTSTLEVSDQIQVGEGPDLMLAVDSVLWVLNRGGFGIDSTVSLINMENDQLLDELQIWPDPSGIVRDYAGNVWIMCSGRRSYHPGGESEGHLLCYAPSGPTLLKDIAFPVATEHPEKLVVNKDGSGIFYIYPGGVKKHEPVSDVIEDSLFIENSAPFYSLGLDVQQNVIYAGDPVDYVQNGWIYRYAVSDGELLDSLSVGIIPTWFCFGE